MDTKTINNNSLLNTFFTSTEFEFIEKIESDVQTFDNMLDQEHKNRDLILKLINGLNDAIYFGGMNNESCDNEKLFLESAKKISDLINTNISILHSNKEVSNTINKSVVDLLVQIESNTSQETEDECKITANILKNKISEFIIYSKKSINDIKSNDAIIYNYFNDDQVQSYFKAYLIDYNLEQKKDLNTFEDSFLSSDILIDKTPENLTDEESNSSNTFEDQILDTYNQISKEENNVSLDSKVYSENNNTLLISEKSNRIYLPYTKEEIINYIEKNPDKYKSFDEVVEKKYIFSSDYFLKHPVFSRFKETYSLIHDKESKSSIEALKSAIDVMFNYNLNPAIIASCKTITQFNNYISCLSKNNLEDFTDFEIKYEVTPLKN